MIKYQHYLLKMLKSLCKLALEQYDLQMCQKIKLYPSVNKFKVPEKDESLGKEKAAQVLAQYFLDNRIVTINSSQSTNGLDRGMLTKDKVF